MIESSSLNQEVFTEKIINIRRVAKVVKGGRRFSFSALIIVGNKTDKIGFGLGKAKDIPEAIKKGKEKALKNILFIDNIKDTIPHSVMGKFNSALVLIYPASKGTGIISGAVSRSVFEVLGINNIVAKSIKSKNCSNLIKATINGLLKLTSYTQKKIQLRKK
jgi:small subunit ribosomal protein S5